MHLIMWKKVWNVGRFTLNALKAIYVYVHVVEEGLKEKKKSQGCHKHSNKQEILSNLKIQHILLQLVALQQKKTLMFHLKQY